MWIRTQNKQRIMNSDQIITIFIDRFGTKILADTADLNEGVGFITLGEYQDRDACMKVLDILLPAISDKRCQWIYMPPNEEVKGWSEDLQEAFGLQSERVEDK